MFYATNKLRHSAYLYTPSGRHTCYCSVCPFCIFFPIPFLFINNFQASDMLFDCIGYSLCVYVEVFIKQTVILFA